MKPTILILVALLLITGCQTTGSKSATSNQSNSESTPLLISKKQLSDRQRSDLYKAILTAELAQGNNQLETAVTHYLYALTIYPDPEIAAETIVLAQKTKDPAALIQASNAWLEQQPNSQKAIEANILGQLMQFDQSEALREDAINEALKQTQKLIDQFSNAEDAFAELSGLSRIYLQGSTLALWQTYLQQHSDSVLAWSLLADAYTKAAQLSKNDSFSNKAEQAIEAAIRTDQTFAPAINLKIQWLQQQGNAEQVTPFLQTLLLQNPQNTGAYAALAQDYYRNKNFDKSIATAKQWLNADPNNLQAQYLVAASYYGQRDFNRSHDMFIQLLDTGYKPQLTFYYCGDTAERIEQFNQAIACYKQVESGNYWYAAQQRLAFLLVNMGREEEALKRLKQYALNSQPEQAEKSIVLRADLLMRLDRQLEAIEWLARFINRSLQTADVPVKHFEAMHQINPENDWVEYANAMAKRLPESLHNNWYLRVSSLLSEDDNAKQAIEFLSQIIQQNPDNIDLLYSRALLRESTGELELMEQELRQLHQLDPDNPHIQNALGYTLADGNKELDFALELIEKAQQSLPSSGAVIDSLGWVHYRKGNLDKAEQLLKTALKLEASRDVFAHLIEVLVENNKQSDAEKLLQQFWPQLNQHGQILQLITKYQLATPEQND
ncbi:tetratricopeptide repeat protein [Pleionea mediterranea]|uniref:Tetratricopeptide repeat protein n=1 Tax=Pleionea mediterranea TaxID=523701 RepID=A0A316FI94_9GAMM|nr:tetratricopeptide repeat protein [Pleionea mediterranea]PWK47835.1 tetratricopeptide repeat protein [Pleionea mediterranea]